jgi:phosphoribosylaminoimidazolecarboxamide formyltransferase/IMP cyclohydrolase
MNQSIRRALLSVSDKTGIVELAQVLEKLGCEIISTGGTQKVLQAAGIATTDISVVTRNPEAFGGRMKTISFQIESALLYDRERDAQEAADLGIEPIDLVVCNLYPFAQVLAQNGSFEELIENIDIGGPTMIRAAAKNFKSVTVVTQPADYEELLQELDKNSGAVSYDFRLRAMASAFNHTADYDALVSVEMQRRATGEERLRLSFDGGKSLRYGENPHQKALFYRQTGAATNLYDAEFLQGKELSYNNLLDAQAAVEAVGGCVNAAVSIIKHSNPCGLAEGADLRRAFELAWAGDVVSAFGSVIAFNRAVDLETVTFLDLLAENKALRKFVEVMIAPDFTPQALEYLQHNKNLRVLKYDVANSRTELDMRYLGGALLVQDADLYEFATLELATEKISWDVNADRDLIAFGVSATKNIKSNAIAVVRRAEDGYLQLMGMGAGQPNRLNSIRLAMDKTTENIQRLYSPTAAAKVLADCILVSDAFFPFEDNVEAAADFGIRRLVQPGGSIRDKHIIDKCHDLGIAMAFTKMRHFKH